MVSSARKGAELSRSHTAFGGGPTAIGDLNWQAADIDCGRHRRTASGAGDVRSEIVAHLRAREFFERFVFEMINEKDRLTLL